MDYSQPRLLAIDPLGCGCTECLTGEYRPLGSATTADIQALLSGEIGDNTSSYWHIEKASWPDSGFIVSQGGMRWTVDRIAVPIPVEYYTITLDQDAMHDLLALGCTELTA